LRTLGEFAALPAPSVSRPLEADYQALARGESGHALRPYAPEAPVREDIVAGNSGRLFGGADAVTTLAERLASRLRGRARGASRLEVTVGSGTGDERITIVSVAQADRPVSKLDEIAALIAPVIGPARATTRIRVVVVGEVAIPADGSASTSTGSGDRSARSEAMGGAAPAGSADPAGGTDPIDLGQLVALGPAGAWQPAAASSPRGREPHRRTRRARRRRTVTLGQSQLFGNVDRSGSGSA
jgi:hypothetical protein